MENYNSIIDSIDADVKSYTKPTPMEGRKDKTKLNRTKKPKTYDDSLTAYNTYINNHNDALKLQADMESKADSIYASIKSKSNTNDALISTLIDSGAYSDADISAITSNLDDNLQNSWYELDDARIDTHKKISKLADLSNDWADKDNPNFTTANMHTMGSDYKIVLTSHEGAGYAFKKVPKPIGKNKNTTSKNNNNKGVPTAGITGTTWRDSQLEDNSHVKPVIKPDMDKPTVTGETTIKGSEVYLDNTTAKLKVGHKEYAIDSDKYNEWVTSNKGKRVGSNLTQKELNMLTDDNYVETGNYLKKYNNQVTTRTVDFGDKGTFNISTDEYDKIKRNSKSIKDIYNKVKLASNQSAIPSSSSIGVDPNITIADYYDNYPALQNIDNVNIVNDTTFTEEYTGIGDIEFMSGEHETNTYPTGNTYTSPYPGEPTVIYNGNNNNNSKQAVLLDVISHGMHADENYEKLYTTFSNKFKKTKYYNDIERNWSDHNKRTDGKNDGKQRYITNEIDGVIRNLLFEGTDEEFKSNKYWNKAKKEYLSDTDTKTAYGNLLHYLRTNETN